MKRFALVALGMLFAITAGSARADIVTDWNAAALKLTQAADAPGGVQSRALAMMHVAMSDAINTVQNRYTRLVADGASRSRTCRRKLPRLRRRGTS